MEKRLFSVLFLFLGTMLFAQESVNNYEYVVVPRQFEFQKSEDQYTINGLTRFLFEKYGFKAYLEGEVPKSLLEKPCAGLRAAIKNSSGMFKTKLAVILTNCSNSVVFESKEGTSMEKDYQKAYHEAIREAFEDVEALNYSYTEAASLSTKPEPKIEKEVAVVKKEEPVKAEQTRVNAEAEKTNPENEPFKLPLTAKSAEGLNYDVSDSEGKRVMKLLFTPVKNVYLVEGKNALVYKNDNGTWIYSETNGMNMTATNLGELFK